MSITVLGHALVNNSQVILANSIQVELPVNVLELTPWFISQNIDGITEQAIYGIHVSFDCENAIVQVVGFSFVALRAYANSAPHFSRLLVTKTGSTVNLVGLNIGQLEVEDTNWQLVDSSADRINVGIRMARSQVALHTDPAPSMNSKVSGSYVGLLRIFVRQASLRVVRSTIAHVTLERPSDPQAPAFQVDSLQIAEGATVERLDLAGSVTDLNLSNSTIEDLRIRGNAIITTVNSTSSTIHRAYNCRLDTFANPTFETWGLIQQSARANNDDVLHAKAGYCGIDLWRNQAGIMRKLAYCLLKYTCGYGYRPGRAIITSFGVIFACTFLFWGMDLLDGKALTLPRDKCEPPATWQEKLGYSAYLSVITFTTTGYGDVVPKNPFARVLAGFEAISGILLMSLFIFALTKRYGSLR